MMSMTKHDLYAAAQQSVESGDLASAEQFLHKALNLAGALNQGKPSADAGEAYLFLARLYRHAGLSEQSNQMYDEAMTTYHLAKGADDATLQKIMHEYGMVLTLQNLQSRYGARAIN